MVKVDDLPPDLREDFEERAAIMEYEGGLPRTVAEREALRIVTEKQQTFSFQK